MNAERETIKAAAIRYSDAVYEGTRHLNILIELLNSTGRIVSGERGFVTNTGRFVGRAEAAQIAWSAGQTYQKLDALYSEEIAFYAD